MVRGFGFFLCFVVAALAASTTPAHSRQPAAPATLVQLDASDPAAVNAVRRSGGVLVSRSLDIWKLAAPAARELVPRLREAGALEVAEPDRRLVPFNHITSGDPLVPSEWWIQAVGLDKVEPPGPGIPVTILDFGLDLTHPEFAGRPNTVSLNVQAIESRDDDHGTAVSSMVAAPANGIGLVGIYPQALLREWDFHEARLSDVLAGLDVGSRTPGVINISGGFLGSSSLLARAVQRAFDRGSLVVAAAGNDRENGSRPFVPAGLPHVLTVAATNQSGRATFFSNRGRVVDLAAPGQGIPVAVPTAFTPSGYDVFDGTSFSSPLVAGAAAWLWSTRPTLDNTQVFDLMRFAARDVPPAGRDSDTGYGQLDLVRMLAAASPARDPQEPNEDVYAVRPHGLSAAGNGPLTARARARLDRIEDPADVYRVWLPPRGRIVVRTSGNHDVNLALWGSRTSSITETGRRLLRDRLAVSTRRGTRADFVSLRNGSSRAAYLYAAVTPGRGTTTAVYSISVATVRR